MENKNVQLVVVASLGIVGIALVWFLVKKLIWLAILVVGAYFAYQFFFGKDPKGKA